MKVYKGFTASPGLVLGQVSRLDRPPLVFGEADDGGSNRNDCQET